MFLKSIEKKLYKTFFENHYENYYNVWKLVIMFIRFLKIIIKNHIKIIIQLLLIFKKLNKNLIFIRFFESVLAKSILWFQFFMRMDFHDPIQNRFF